LGIKRGQEPLKAPESCLQTKATNVSTVSFKREKKSAFKTPTAFDFNFEEGDDKTEQIQVS
jgi:hypothetical protein